MRSGVYHHTEKTKEKIRESNRRRLISPETRKRMSLSGTGKHDILGEKNPMWNGGSKIRQDGYVLVRLYPDDPFYAVANKSGYAMEHRLIMSQKLGRVLLPFPLEVINHKNGHKSDNREENLEVCSQSSHLQEHTQGYQVGYEKGFADGQNEQICLLKDEIKRLRKSLYEE